MGFRNDLELISSWINPNSKVLDLGCGDGYILNIHRLPNPNATKALIISLLSTSRLIKTI